MKYKIISILVFLAFAGVVFWMIPILKDRYFEKSVDENEETIDSLSEEEKLIFSDDEEENSLPADESLDEIPANKEENSEKAPVEDLLKITADDCSDECENYKDDEEDLRYCQERCGINQKPIPESLDCSDLEDLEKDYCLKNLAISKDDIKKCEEISDAGIKETCRNRIMEEILEDQKLE